MKNTRKKQGRVEAEQKRKEKEQKELEKWWKTE